MGRVTAVLGMALLVMLAASVAFYEQIDRFSVREDHARRVAELLVVGDRLAQRAPDGDRAAAIAVLSTQHLRVGLRDTPIADGSAARSDLGALRDSIRRWEPGLAGRSLHLKTVRSERGSREDLIGTLALPSGGWLYFRSYDLYQRWALVSRIGMLAGLLMLGVLLSAALLLRMLGSPLRALGVAADAIGRGKPVTLVESGPRDVRRVAHAFNGMQARIDRLVADRTQALAAVSHDLRTPLARLKLASDYVPAGEIQTMIARDIDDMEQMLGSLLAYLRAEQNPETPQQIDLTTLVQTVVSEASDLGHETSFEGAVRMAAVVRPLGLRRALSNLIENAAKYGWRARVSLARVGDMARIVVADDGPGIAEESLVAVFEPFVRLDGSRAHAGGSFGLGLAIAQRLIASEGGTLSLSNRESGGLDATILLPIGRREAGQSSSSS